MIHLPIYISNEIPILFRVALLTLRQLYCPSVSEVPLKEVSNIASLRCMGSLKAISHLSNPEVCGSNPLLYIHNKPWIMMCICHGMYCATVVGNGISKIELLVNSLSPGLCMHLKCYIINFRTDIKDRYLEHFLWHCPQVNATRLHWW